MTAQGNALGKTEPMFCTLKGCHQGRIHFFVLPLQGKSLGGSVPRALPWAIMCLRFQRAAATPQCPLKTIIIMLDNRVRPTEHRIHGTG
jgi:hypothetical protein